MNVDLLKSALWYAARGWPALPLHTIRNGECTCSKGADCDKPGKHPQFVAGLFEHGAKSATTDPEKIRATWKRFPKANIGIATGQQSFDVLDVDLDGDGPGTLVALEAVHGSLSDTIEQITGSGGRQVFFAPSGRLKNAVRFASGLDIRSDGGLVVVPPSLHLSGRWYEWEASSRPESTALAPMPEWLIEVVQAAGRTDEGNGSKSVDVAAVWAGIPEGSRDQELFRYACKLRTQGLTRQEAEALILAAAGRCVPPFPESDALAKVESAWRYPGPETALCRTFNLTDLGNAERLVAAHRQDIRFCHAWGKWLTWDGIRWAVDDTGVILRLAKTTVRGIYQEAARADDEDRRKALAKHARSSEAVGKLAAMATLAQSENGIPIRPDDLDRDPWLLNVSNGTVDLRTGELRKHRREDFITKLAPVVYDPAATSPQWVAFLEKITADRSALIDYLQKAIGWALTGIDPDRTMFILHGTGANGKTILTATIGSMLGDYALETPVETLMIRRNEGIPNDIARLKGARLVTAAEGERGQRLAESLIKRLTGGDKVSARFLHGEFFDFIPVFKLWLSTNHKPVIRGTDTGIWDRIHLVPFDVTILPADRIPRTTLMDRLEKEWPGILAWAVQGCLKWQSEGLRKPDEVEQATAGYREEQDILGGFLADCCVVNPLAKVKTADLYVAYEVWCNLNHDEALQKRVFITILQERGFKQARIGSRSDRGWQGIGLRSQTDTQTHTDAVFTIFPSGNKNEKKKVKSVSGYVCASVEITCSTCGFFRKNGEKSNLPGTCTGTPHDGYASQYPLLPHECGHFQPLAEGASA